jgi:hypothetical protein
MTFKNYLFLRTILAASIGIGFFLAMDVKADDQPKRAGKTVHREVHGYVSKIQPALIYVKIPGIIQHRTLEVKRAERLGIKDLKPGDELLLVVDEDNLIIDAHLPGHPTHHRIVEGTLVEKLPLPKEIKVATAEGTQTFKLDPVAVSKLGKFKTDQRIDLELDESGMVVDIHPTK